MSFLQKLKLNIPTEETEISAEPLKRKRGRPRKFLHTEPSAGVNSSKETIESQSPIEKRKRGRPPKIREEFAAKEEKREEGELTIDVYETDKELVIQSPVAGVKPEDIEVTIEDDMLIIRGARPAPLPEEREKTIMQECYWGPFSRRLILPVEVYGQVKASLERGILTIRMPKMDRGKKRKIAVEEVEE